MCRNILADVCEQLPRCVAVCCPWGISAWIIAHFRPSPGSKGVQLCLDLVPSRSAVTSFVFGSHSRDHRAVISVDRLNGQVESCGNVSFLHEPFRTSCTCTAELNARRRTTPMTILIRTKLRCQNLLTPARSWTKQNK